MKENDSEVAGGGEDSQHTQPKNPNPIHRTGRPVPTEQTSSSSAQEIDKRVLFDSEQGDLLTVVCQCLLNVQQNNACNPISYESKTMIREWGNVELFELCETIPKVQCSESLESRNGLFHLWSSLEGKRIQSKFSPMATGCFLNPALRHQKRAMSWCSTRQN